MDLRKSGYEKMLVTGVYNELQNKKRIRSRAGKAGASHPSQPVRFCMLKDSDNGEFIYSIMGRLRNESTQEPDPGVETPG